MELAPYRACIQAGLRAVMAAHNAYPALDSSGTPASLSRPILTDVLRNELQYLIDNDVIKGGEYQLPDALRNMTEKGAEFLPGTVDDWLDCGNKNATVHTNSAILGYTADELSIPNSVKQENSIIIPPCYIGENVELTNSVIGPGVSVGNGSVIENCRISDSIIYENSTITSAHIAGSMIGSSVKLAGKTLDISLSDYSTYEG